MNKIPFALGQAAQVAVLPPNAEATYANAAGGMSVFAGLVLSKRGKPRSVLALTKETYLDVLGDAIQPHEGSAFEPIRHVAQALNGGNGYVVRVTPKNMRIPVLKLTQPASTTSSGTPTIDEQQSYFSSSVTSAQADGSSRIAFMFYPKDSNGAIITGLKGLTLNPINAPANITIVPFTESNGVYTAYLSSATSGTITVGLRYAADPSALAGYNRDVKFIPAIVDAGRSSITQTATTANANTDASLADKVTITLFARDSTGQPVENRTDIDFYVSGLNGVSKGQVFAGTTPGSYSIVISGAIAGTANILARQNGKEITGKSVNVDFTAQQVGTFRDIDPTNSQFEYVGGKTQILANNLDAIEFKLTAKDKSKKPVTGIASELRFNVSGIAITFGGFSEVSPGEYIGSFTTNDSSGNAAIVSVERSGTLISSDSSFSRSIQVVAVVSANTADPTNSRLPAVDIKNDGQPVVLSFYANDASSQALTGLTDLQFVVTSGNATLANGGTPVESVNTLGIYEIEVTSQTTGVITVAVNQGGTLVKSTQMNVIEANPPAVSATVTPDGNHVAGEDMHIAVTPIDVLGALIPGLTNLLLTVELNGAPVTPAPLLVEDINNPGVYEAVLTSRVAGTGTVSALQGTNTVALGTASIEFTAPVTTVDDGQSNFNATPPTVKADGTEEITLTFEAKDSSGNALPGLAISFGVLNGDDKHLTFSQIVENNGTYTATVTSIKGGTWTVGPLEGATNPAAIGTKTKTITFTAGLGTVSTPSYLSINGLGAYDSVPAIVADGTAQTLEFHALDVDGDPITGLTDADIEFKVLSQDPAAGITVVTTPTEVGNGLYTAELSADLKVDGYVEVVVVNKLTSDELTYPLSVDFTSKPVQLDTAASVLTASADTAEMGTGSITLELTLTDVDKDPVLGKASQIRFATSSLVTMSDITEDQATPGKYTVTATSPYALGALAVTPMFETVDAQGAKQWVEAITGKQPFVIIKFTDPADVGVLNPDKSKFTASATKADIGDDQSTGVTFTLTLLDAQGNPYKGKASEIRFDTSHLVTKSAVTETPADSGIYTVKVTSPAAKAQIAVTPRYKTTDAQGQEIWADAYQVPKKDPHLTVKFIDPNAGVVVTPPPVTVKTATLVGSAATAETGDASSAGITMTLTLVGSDDQPMTGKAGVVQFKTTPQVDVGTVTETPANSGIYTAKLTWASAQSAIAVTPVVDGTEYAQATPVTVEFTTPAPVVKAIDDGNSSLAADKTAPKAHDGDEVILTFTAHDDQNQPISGLESDLTFAADDNTGITIVSALAEDGTTGVYKQTITRTGYGAVTFTVNNSGTPTGVTATVTFVPTAADISGEDSSFYKDLVVLQNDTDVATLTFEPQTADNVAIPGLNVTFVRTSAAVATTVITQPTETAPGSGIYTGTVTGSVDDDFEVKVQVDGVDVADVDPVDVTVAIIGAAPPVPQPDAQYIERLSVARLNAAPVYVAPAPAYVPAYQEAAPVSSGSMSAAAYAVGTGSGSGITLSATTVGVGDDVTLGNNEVIAIYVDDGDASTDRTLRLEPHPDEPDFWILTLSQVLSQTESRVLEQVTFSLTPGEIDDMGLPAYLPVALENSDSRLRAVVRSNAHLPASYQGFLDQYFIGGTDGDMSTIGPDDYTEALNILAASMVNYTAVLALGVYDPIVLQALANHARDVRVDMFCDIRPAVSGTQAIQEAADQSLGAYSHVARYHFPYSSKDPLTGAQVVYGLSGDAFTAKAKGVSMKPDVGGWHYAPAGYTRAVLERSNIKPLAGAASVDREKFVTSRINPVTVASDGSVMIDDSLTTFGKNNYLKYQHVNSILNAIARMTYDVCQTMKHEPDGVTREGLEKEIPRLLERFVASEALVKPRDATQGEEPFVVVVKQEDFDLWNIKVFVCPTGVARRIAVEPILFR